MKEPAFDKTPEFEHFKEVMRGVLAVPKKRLDELLQEARVESSESVKPRKSRTRKRAAKTR